MSDDTPPAQPPSGTPMPPPPPAGGPPPPAPPGGGVPPYPGGAGPADSTDAAGFFKALFDFSFSTFITPKVVKFVYVVATVLIALGWLFFLAASFASSAGAGVLVLVVGPVVAVLYLAFIRMTLEFYLAVVRMSEDIHHRLRLPS
ncbi:MAG TPA: DUF4282 domain-containing protein [Marmoricola sp.]|nr:DUF4282 domain-containing protein [Marmoricola sp.]